MAAGKAKGEYAGGGGLLRHELQKIIDVTKDIKGSPGFCPGIFAIYTIFAWERFRAAIKTAWAQERTRRRRECILSPAER